MAIPARPSLGATTTARKWMLDVDISPTGVPQWIPVRGLTEFTPTGAPNMEEDGDYDGGGYGSSSATGLDWGATATMRRGADRTDPTKYDDGQEFLRLKGNKMGDANTAHVRYYEFTTGGPKVEAWEGYAAVSYQNNGGGPRALSTAGLTLTGQGARLAVTHPDDSLSGVALISGFDVASTSTAGGALIVMSGYGLSTATALSIGGVAVAVTDWEPISYNKLAFKAPAKTAGAQPVIVTNASGASVPVNLTYV